MRWLRCWHRYDEGRNRQRVLGSALGVEEYVALESLQLAGRYGVAATGWIGHGSWSLELVLGRDGKLETVVASRKKRANKRKKEEIEDAGNWSGPTTGSSGE